MPSKRVNNTHDRQSLIGRNVDVNVASSGFVNSMLLYVYGDIKEISASLSGLTYQMLHPSNKKMDATSEPAVLSGLG